MAGVGSIFYVTVVFTKPSVYLVCISAQFGFFKRKYKQLQQEAEGALEAEEGL